MQRDFQVIGFLQLDQTRRMACELITRLDFEQLQNALSEPCVAHEALKLERQQQETSTDRWLQQRTRELETEALEQK